MHKTLWTLMKTAGCAALLALGIQSASAQAVRLGHITAPTHVWNQVSERIATGIAEASQGQMRVTVAPQQRLGNEVQMINLLQTGAMQMGVLSVAGLSNREASLFAWSLPYVFRDVEHASRAATTPAAREMLGRLDAHGMVGLGYAFAGMRHVLSLTPVRTPQDIANKKIRVFPSQIFNEWWSAIGGAPTAMPLSEVAPSLTTRLLDAVDIDLDALVSLRMYQQAPYLTLTNHMAFPAAIVVSKRWWDARSEAERTMIRRVVAEAEAWGFAAAIAADRANLAAATAGGVTVVNANLAPFRTVGATVTNRYTALNPLIATFHTQVRGL
jgi:TRAP-type C4-dicarboxylate transport system substrate-binding protein